MSAPSAPGKNSLAELGPVAAEFSLRGRLVSAAPYGNGHINETYVLVADDAGSLRRYVLQKINHRIFKNVPALMDNVRRVTEHVAAKMRATAGEGAARRALTVVPAHAGGVF